MPLTFNLLYEGDKEYKGYMKVEDRDPFVNKSFLDANYEV